MEIYGKVTNIGQNLGEKDPAYWHVELLQTVVHLMQVAIVRDFFRGLSAEF